MNDAMFAWIGLLPYVVEDAHELRLQRLYLRFEVGKSPGGAGVTAAKTCWLNCVPKPPRPRTSRRDRASSCSLTSTVAIRWLLVSSVSNGVTSATYEPRARRVRRWSAPGRLELDRDRQTVGTFTDLVPSTDGPQSRVTVALAAVSPFSSATSAMKIDRPRRQRLQRRLHRRDHEIRP